MNTVGKSRLYKWFNKRGYSLYRVLLSPVLIPVAVVLSIIAVLGDYAYHALGWLDDNMPF